MVGNNRGVLFSAFQTPPARRSHDIGCRSGAAPPRSPGRELVGGCASPRGPRSGHPLAGASPAPSGGCFATGRRACVGRSTPAGSPLRVPGRSPSRSGARRGLLCVPEVSPVFLPRLSSSAVMRDIVGGVEVYSQPAMLADPISMRRTPRPLADPARETPRPRCPHSEFLP